MQKAKNIITLPLKGYKNNYKSYQQRIAIQENKTQWCITAHSHKVHPTLGFGVLLGGAGGQGQPCSSKAPQAGSGRILAVSALVFEWIPTSERHTFRVQPESQTQETKVLGSALLLTASPQPLGAPYWWEVQRRQEGPTLPISQACRESTERSCAFMKLEKLSLNIKVSLPILETEDIFYMYYKELKNTAPWGRVRFLDYTAEPFLSEPRSPFKTPRSYGEGFALCAGLKRLTQTFA